MTKTRNTFRSTDEQRWQAVLDRRPPADDGFVYAVETTGVFCLPGCASRRPNRSNVRFFETAEDAKSAGFRPCRRCRPDRKGTDLATAAVTRACRRLEQEDVEPTLPELAAEAGYSPAHFQKLFKSCIGLSPKQYAKGIRAKRMGAALLEGSTVTDALYESGYGAASRAYEAATDTLGMTPSRYRSGANGETIRFATATSALGPVIVAGTRRGVCAVEFGESRNELLRLIQARFPGAVLQSAGKAFESWLSALLTFIETPQAGLDLPLDIQGTAFQQRVWNALLKIPAGETMTYSELARRLGMPRGARAVASAIAANRIALAVPCHRVIRKDGDLADYRWGVARKRDLLAREKAART